MIKRFNKLRLSRFLSFNSNYLLLNKYKLDKEPRAYTYLARAVTSYCKALGK